MGSGHELAIVAALLEQDLGMCLLEVAGANLCRRDLRRNRENRHAGSVAIEQTIDEREMAGSAAPRAEGEPARRVRRGTRREGRHLLMTDMHPFDLALTTEEIG